MNPTTHPWQGLLIHRMCGHWTTTTLTTACCLEIIAIATTKTVRKKTSMSAVCYQEQIYVSEHAWGGGGCRYLIDCSSSQPTHHLRTRVYPDCKQVGQIYSTMQQLLLHSSYLELSRHLGWLCPGQHRGKKQLTLLITPNSVIYIIGQDMSSNLFSFLYFTYVLQYELSGTEN